MKRAGIPVLLALAGLIVLARLGGDRRAPTTATPTQNGAPNGPVRSMEAPMTPSTAPHAEGERRTRFGSERGHSTPDPSANEPVPTPAGTRVTLRVLDARGGPIEGARLWTDERTVAWTDDEGRVDDVITLQERPPTITTSWRVTAAGHRAQQLVLPSVAHEVHLGTVTLQAGGAVEGTVFDLEGQPVAGAQVEWMPHGDEHAARHDRRAAHLSLETTTDTQGKFLLDGLPDVEGQLHVQASQGRSLTGEPFLALPSQRVRQELHLAPSTDPRLVTGVVLDPEGQPASDVHLSLGTSFLAGRAISDSGGAFEIRLGGRGPWTLQAVDDARWYPSRALPVQGGERDVELRMQPPRWLHVRLIDGANQPIPWGTLEVRRAWPLPTKQHALGRSGETRILRPWDDVQMRAFAPGYRTVQISELAPDQEQLDIAMETGQAVRGRVLVDGQPRAGVSVSVLKSWAGERSYLSTRLTRGDERFVLHGSADPARVDATTDRDGRFVTTLHNDGWHSVTLWAPDLPIQTLGPFHWSKETGADGLELAMRRGGALEGTVLVPAGADPEGRLVAVCAGWNYALTTAVDAQGRYRFEELAPGPYQVREALPPAAAVQFLGSFSDRHGEPTATWDVRVPQDGRAHFDLDLRWSESVRLDGRFALGEWTGVNVALREQDPTGEHAGLPLAATDSASDGSFELAVGQPGRHLLQLWGPPETFVVEAEFELDVGLNTWRFEHPSGAVHLTRSPASPDTCDAVRFEWRSPSDTRVTVVATYRPGQEERRVVSPLPVGEVEVTEWDSERGEFRPLGSVRVREDEEAIFELP